MVNFLFVFTDISYTNYAKEGNYMSVNGVNNSNTYSNVSVPSTTKANSTGSSKSSSTDTHTTTASSSTTVRSDDAAVYESSSSNASTKTSNPALVAQLKADSENRIAQMQSLVQKMFSKQGISIGTADDMWKVLASGNFTADADTIAQAKEDISENGYWGVSQTSDRIFSFAEALAGGDAEQMEKMRAAVEKGFKEATKSWGKTLPSISSDTYDAVMKKFDDYAANKSATNTAATK